MNGGLHSNSASVCYGVTQGLGLGPFGFCIYLLPLRLLLRHLGLSFHPYADVTQIYIICSSFIHTVSFIINSSLDGFPPAT